MVAAEGAAGPGAPGLARYLRADRNLVEEARGWSRALTVARPRPSPGHRKAGAEAPARLSG
ncbi:hypothetical protein GCM10009095_00670 [Sphingomonas molluscorum]|nr:hypothetical protein GCM10017606_11110 [Microbacterium terregens]